MNRIRHTPRRGATVLLLLALVALAAVATVATAKETKKLQGDDLAIARRGRVDTPPMTFLQGVLYGGNGNWSVGDQPVRFEQSCTLIDQANPDDPAARSGAQVVLMGYLRQGVFVAYTGMILPEAYQVEPPNDAAKAHVTWSETDPTVGAADNSIPK